MTARDAASPGMPVLEVVEPGLLLAVQDGGRPGLAFEGVTRGGAADPWSLAVANCLVGNAPDAAALEATLLGPTVRAIAPVTIGIAGAMAGRVGGTGERVAAGTSVTLARGQELVLEPTGGARGYLALPGGVDVPVLLGSRSTSLGAGFGGFEGRALRAGDRVAAAGATGGGRGGTTFVLPRADWPGEPCPVPVSPVAPLLVLPGPHADALGPDGLSSLVEHAWTVASASDRVGLRLDDAPLLRATSTGDLASQGVVVGTVQVPPDGRPIVLLVDHQPTGGYPVLAVVIAADLPRLGQLAPGAPVAFARTTPTAARDALARADAAFARSRALLREAEGWDELWHGAGA